MHATYLPFFYLVNFFVTAAAILLLFSRIFAVFRRHVSMEGGNSANSTNKSCCHVFKLTGSGQQFYTRLKNSQVQSVPLHRHCDERLDFGGTVCVYSMLHLSARRVGIGRSRSGDCLPNDGHIFSTEIRCHAILYVIWIRTFREVAIALCSCRRRRTSTAT